MSLEYFRSSEGDVSGRLHERTVSSLALFSRELALMATSTSGLMRANGASARPAARVNGAQGAKEEETFVLRATPSIKRYNIARFDVPTVPKFSTCAQPVMMYREPEKVIEDEEEKKEEEIGYNPALRKRRRRRRKDTRTANWVIEDNEGKNKYVGAFEGGQSSMYCLFVKNRHNDEFSVIPVEHWFRFKKPLNYRTLTLEEAEELNNEKKRAVERWLMKHKMFNDEKTESNDVVGAPRVRTGAVGGGAKKKPGEEGGDIFEVKESKPRRAAPRPKKAAEGEAMGEDGGDFDEKFDDDESEAEIEHEDAKAVESESDDEDFGEGEGTGKLTETGQAMKDLLKRAQSGEMSADKEQDNETGEGSDEEYSAQDMDVIRDLGGNIIRGRAPAAAASGGDANANGGDKSGDANGSAKGNEATNGKRTATDDAPGQPPAKVQKTPPPKPVAPTASSAVKLTEAHVQNELIRFGGRMKSRDLLKKLKKLLQTDSDRALLKDILRTICNVEKDAIEGNLFVLKAQFR
ncbi:hypothetical protein Poli38472_008765 [Pythium oligandrum]|uniref:Transcription initiation factor IIF subunit alpha n=1 Tax=Pythium oligandrum TaxID=41045 RepID=A0A8K1FDZ9_PYTOL|nr:hypothetical protein Poli38472_008765 [Pythium oligandrum]|eukprot:TMW56117.1 hypothetical protein Poli38472_008765 [Pythium oligandrum]